MKIGRKAVILNNLRHVTSDTTPNFVSLTLRPMFIVENLRHVTNSPILASQSPFKRATIWPTRAPFKPNPIFNPKEARIKQAPYLI